MRLFNTRVSFASMLLIAWLFWRWMVFTNLFIALTGGLRCWRERGSTVRCSECDSKDRGDIIANGSCVKIIYQMVSVECLGIYLLENIPSRWNKILCNNSKTSNPFLRSRMRHLEKGFVSILVWCWLSNVGCFLCIVVAHTAQY